MVFARRRTDRVDEHSTSRGSEAHDSLCRLFEGLGYVGPFNAEFKYDARDGRFKILEVNARLVAGRARHLWGLDVCRMA